MYRFLRRALTLCLRLCMGIQLGACFPARSANAEALSATLYGHVTQAIYRNRPIHRIQNELDDVAGNVWQALTYGEFGKVDMVGRCRVTLSNPR